MKFKSPQTLASIAHLIQSRYVGNQNFKITGINEIHVVQPGDIVFVDHPKYYEKALNSAATIILINKEVDCPKGKALLISDDPFRDFNKITTHFNPFISSNVSISKTAIVGEGFILFTLSDIKLYFIKNYLFDNNSISFFLKFLK